MMSSFSVRQGGCFLCSSLQDLDCYVIDNHGFVLVSKQQNDVSTIAQPNVSPSLLWRRPNWCCFSFLIAGAIPGWDRRLSHDDIDPNGHVQKVLTWWSGGSGIRCLLLALCCLLTSWNSHVTVHVNLGQITPIDWLSSQDVINFELNKCYFI